MAAFTHTDQSSLAKWWYNTDRKLFFFMSFLIIVGFIMTLTAGPYAARRMGMSDYHFLKGFIVAFFAGGFSFFFFAMLNPKWLKRIIYAGVAVFIFLTIAVLFIGTATKGASRWIDFGVIKLQPSEVLKPFFIAFWGIILTKINLVLKKNKKDALYLWAMLGVTSAITILAILLQPDNGMALTFMVVMLGQLFLFGIWKKLIFASIGGIISLGILLYFVSPHFSDRINNFINPSSEASNYQVISAMKAIKNGGLLPVAVAQGRLKQNIPDSHTDFVLAVFTEEFGLLATWILVSLYFLITLTILFKVKNQKSEFIALTGGGFAILFLFQALVNTATTFNLMPTKGMTLPFVSYGGSSFISFCICFGILLNFFNRENEPEGYKI